MSKAQIKKLIYLSGIRPDYVVRTGFFDGQMAFPVATARVGHAIVRALRQEAEKRPDLLQVSLAKGTRRQDEVYAKSCPACGQTNAKPGNHFCTA